jgi:curved DNA-binding protein CbpA
MKNYYAILGVPNTASHDDIKRAFRKLAIKYHPDKNSSPEAENIFKEITEAYDVLSDWEKRKVYDLRWENPFKTLTQDPPAPSHKDPKYRPKPPGYRPPKSHTIKDTMAEYLPYFRYICWAGLAITLLLAIDFFTPYHKVTANLVEVEEVVGKRNQFRHFIFHPEGGKEILVYDYTARYLTNEKKIVFHETRIFKTVMYLSDIGPVFQVKLGYLYKTLVFFPLLLFFSSAMGLLYRKSVEFPFNLTIVSGMLMIITLGILIFL